METIFYVLCTSLPCHVIVFYQYWDMPWRSRKLAIALASANLLLKLMAVSWCLRTGYSVRGVEFFFSFVGIAIYFALLKVSWPKLLFTYVLVLDFLVVLRGVASFITVYFLSAGPQSWQSGTVCVGLILLSLPWLLRRFRLLARQVYATDAPSLWHAIWLPPALTTAVVLIYTNAYDPDSIGSWTSFLARVILMGSVLITYYVLLQALDSIQRQAALEEQARQSEYILSLQRAQYAHIREHMEEIRRARHDLRQHQNIIRSFLKTGDTAALRDYLSAQDGPEGLDSFHRYCENYGVNMLLNHYAGRLSAADADYRFQAELPETVPVPEPDLCVVVGNLLENALEACAGQPEPFVQAAIRLSGERAIAIVVDNTSPLPPDVGSEGVFRSTKHAGDGVGTQSIRYIARRYNGAADFRWEDGMFRASVFLNPASGENNA